MEENKEQIKPYLREEGLEAGCLQCDNARAGGKRGQSVEMFEKFPAQTTMNLSSISFKRQLKRGWLMEKINSHVVPLNTHFSYCSHGLELAYPIQNTMSFYNEKACPFAIN